MTVRDREPAAGARRASTSSPFSADVLDRRAHAPGARRAASVLFHTAGMVASRPPREVWRVNAVAPRIAVEAAADAGVRRVVVTSSVGRRSARRRGATRRERAQPLSRRRAPGCSTRTRSTRASWRRFAAGERLGRRGRRGQPLLRARARPLNRSLPGETSTRIVANYLRGRLPAIVDSYTNIVDVEDVAAGPPARRRSGPAGRALHPRRREPALVRGDRAGRADSSGRPPSADRAAARGRRRAPACCKRAARAVRDRSRASA